MRRRLPLIALIVMWGSAIIVGVLASRASGHPAWLGGIVALVLGFMWGVGVSLHVEYALHEPPKPKDLKWLTVSVCATATIFTLLVLVWLLPFPINCFLFLALAFIGSVIIGAARDMAESARE